MLGVTCSKAKVIGFFDGRKKTLLLISSAEFDLFFLFCFLLGEFDKGHIYIYTYMYVPNDFVFFFHSCFFRTWGVERVGSSYAPTPPSSAAAAG